MDTQGVDRVFEAMESARAAIEDAKPLLTQAVKLSDEVGTEVLDVLASAFGMRALLLCELFGALACATQILPLLTELRAGNLVGNVEALTQARTCIAPMPARWLCAVLPLLPCCAY
jgi:hypothetical protein